MLTVRRKEYVFLMTYEDLHRIFFKYVNTVS